MADPSFALRELFHLNLLRFLGPRLARRPYAVKGGIGLRFFHRSPRLSEDMDLDVTSKMPVPTLQKAVDHALHGSALPASLLPHGIRELQVTKPKHTETTQRWKVGLVTASGPILSTRVEFSRRKENVEGESGIPQADLLRRYQI